MLEQVSQTRADKTKQVTKVDLVKDSDQMTKFHLQLETSMITTLFTTMIAKVKQDMSQILEPANFYGESEEYMKLKQIPFSLEGREEYAQCIYKEFLASLEDSIIYDETKKMIYISPYIFDLEYGSFYRPSLQYITKMIGDAIQELTLSINTN